MEIPNAATVRSYPAGMDAFPRHLISKVRCLVDGNEVAAYAYNISEGWALSDNPRDKARGVVGGRPIKHCGKVEVVAR